MTSGDCGLPGLTRPPVGGGLEIEKNGSRSSRLSVLDSESVAVLPTTRHRAHQRQARQQHGVGFGFGDGGDVAGIAGE